MLVEDHEIGDKSKNEKDFHHYDHNKNKKGTYAPSISMIPASKYA